jgi:glycosyltransferase involved in cell wall biosynthesis
MAKHLVALASDETLRKRLGRAARAAAVEQHSWNKSARRILELSGVRV